ncbi:MAG TPA: hypothetical protein VNO32_21195 [Candidatus Acidoferrum sp.]|nr:hypothetical protein [Candidatus Acidoferrum sp.]
MKPVIFASHDFLLQHLPSGAKRLAMTSVMLLAAAGDVRMLVEPRSGTRRKLTPRCIVNYSTSPRSAIDAYGPPPKWAEILCDGPLRPTGRANL